MSVEVTKTGSDGAAFAARNRRLMCERTCGVLVALFMDASWKTSEKVQVTKLH